MNSIIKTSNDRNQSAEERWIPSLHRLYEHKPSAFPRPVRVCVCLCVLLFANDKNLHAIHAGAAAAARLLDALS